MPPGTNLDNVVRSISSKQIPEDSMSPVTTFEVPVSIPDPPVTTCEAPVGPAPPEKRPRTWEDMAAAAGVLIMTSADNEEPDLEPVQKKKKMTPKEYRQMKPKPKTNPSITLSVVLSFFYSFLALSALPIGENKSKFVSIQRRYFLPTFTSSLFGKHHLPFFFITNIWTKIFWWYFITSSLSIVHLSGFFLQKFKLVGVCFH